MSARRHIASRPGISFLHHAGGEYPLPLDQNRAGPIAALFILPVRAYGISESFLTGTDRIWYDSRSSSDT